MSKIFPFFITILTAIILAQKQKKQKYGHHVFSDAKQSLFNLLLKTRF